MITKKQLVLLVGLFCTVIAHGDQRSFITGNAFKQLADYVIDQNNCPFDPAVVPEKSIIFIKTDFLNFFFNKVFPRLKHQIIIISHKSNIYTYEKRIFYFIIMCIWFFKWKNLFTN